jgi:nicotinate-nucleotide pyrophosphorylase (carboxylating)
MELLTMVGIAAIITNALSEDIHTGDITTAALMPEPRQVHGHLLAKEDLVLSGIDIPRQVFHQLDASVTFTAHCLDGEKVGAGTILASFSGEASVLLQGERVALNLLQRMCGTASLTRKYVDAVEGLPVRIVDTRKTTPGLRVLEKYSVRVGGGFNHRTGLYDGVLIKENHIAAAGSITTAVQRARNYISHTLKIEVETETLDQVREALSVGADIIMLDNMDCPMMREAASIIGGRALIEASGGVTLETVRHIAETGVNIISVGALTHSAKAMDISLLLEGA